MSEQDAYKLEKVEPLLTDAQLDNAVKPIIQEYLEHGDTGEVEVGCGFGFYSCTSTRPAQSFDNINIVLCLGIKGVLGGICSRILC